MGGWGLYRPSPGPRPTQAARTPGFPSPSPPAWVSDNNRTTGNPGTGRGQPGQWPGFARYPGALGVPPRGWVGVMYHPRAIFSGISVSDPPIQKPPQPIPGHSRHHPGPTQPPGSTGRPRFMAAGADIWARTMPLKRRTQSPPVCPLLSCPERWGNGRTVRARRRRGRPPRGAAAPGALTGVADVCPHGGLQHHRRRSECRERSERILSTVELCPHPKVE
jgi:hypothetical protein